MPHPKLPASPTPATHEQTEKGCVHWYRFTTNSSAGTISRVHPCIIVSRVNKGSNRVIISPISDITNYVENGQIKYPYHAPLYQAEYNFLEKNSVVLLDQMFTIGKSELYQEWYMGKVTDTRKIDEAILYNFDLFESMLEAYSELVSQYKDIYSSNFSRR
ncbi:type II toxin-antitoxin system PemK/MazF family toxin [Brevibacillus agri]|uniref:type II toxin-antitoxin system PemK/MazF family toxin n=1 Tax=Brevibacillus agri TaxID=51101 RepID=UPI002E248632|nr:type II toxin-antitoxin system PemK/MazF family toxin [Brevibacillus agri]